MRAGPGLDARRTGFPLRAGARSGGRLRFGSLSRIAGALIAIALTDRSRLTLSHLHRGGLGASSMHSAGSTSSAKIIVAIPSTSPIERIATSSSR